MTTPKLTDLPARDVLTVDGVGAPETPAFMAAIKALLSVQATLGGGYAPVEGSYAQDGDPMRFDLNAPQGWHWQLVVPAPPSATADAVASAAEGSGAPVQLRHAPATQAAELLHLGPYEDEAPSLKALYAFVAEQGLEPAGAHMEVYLDDPSIIPPADLRTILRVPVKTKA